MVGMCFMKFVNKRKEKRKKMKDETHTYNRMLQSHAYSLFTSKSYSKPHKFLIGFVNH